MLMKKYFYKIALLPALCLTLAILSACSDWFTVMPESEMVLGDYWKKKSDVLSSVGSCYRAMIEEGFVKRLIAWGEVRSDNMLYGKSSETDLTYLIEANLNGDNSYTRWGEFYTVINYCNTVIKYAPGVRSLDPDFSQVELDHFLAEAKTIRAFCYFQLVRTFNRVPFIVDAYSDDSRSYRVAQSSGDSIIKVLVGDLASIEETAPVEYSSIAYTKGRVTQKAVWALMADMYLWLNDYTNCVTYCDKILAATANSLELVRSSAYYNSVFFKGNSNESIWELQFDNNTPNYAVRDFYGGSSQNGKLTSYNYSKDGTSTLFNAKDLRLINGFASKDGYYMIKKYIASRASTNYDNVKEADFGYGDATNNWILYRLPDVYLMKAEALAEEGGSDNLAEAVALVSLTYDRANPQLEPNSLVGLYTSQEDVRQLVLDERQREFMFEGKRYFDLMRRMRRDGTPTAVINTYLINKYVAMNLDRSTVISKLNDVDAIYMPINNSELKVNPLLTQNRFYMVSSDISKK